MKAFISYSHKDNHLLERLHAHLSTLVRAGLLSSWTDEMIPAGGHLDSTISRELNTSQLFIALLSPDYLASNYCYEKEFQTALGMNKAGDLIIVPIVVEPCDWLSTPFKEFKALPLDGKAISTWENTNTAFLNVTQSLRKLIEGAAQDTPTVTSPVGHAFPSTRNYRVKKDFDSIEKIEFTEKSFRELVDYLKRFSEEVSTLDNIRTRVLQDSPTEFQCLLVNRNKIATECQLQVKMESPTNSHRSHQFYRQGISFTLSQGNGGSPKEFSMAHDDYHLFWTESNPYFGNQQMTELTAKEMADQVWEEWLEAVGIS
jgi:hypothetical protein